MARPRGCVTKRGNSWVAIISETNPETGKRTRHYHSGYPTKRDADQARTQLLGSMDRGMFVSPTDLTVETFLTEKWLQSIRGTLRVSSYSSYEGHVKRYLVPGFGKVRLQSLRSDQLNRLYQVLRERGGLNGRSLSERTVQLSHRTLRKALQDALRWGYVARNVADAANPPRVTRKPEMAVWAAFEVRQFLDSVADDRLASMWHLFITTGMRRGEVLGLRWCDVSTNGVTVRQTLIAVENKVVFSAPKTKRSERLVVLDSATAMGLREHRTRQTEERLKAGPVWNELDLVFADEVGQPLHPDRITKRFLQLSRECELPRIRLHDLRHTWATLALQKGVHPKIVAERLGHSSITLTLDTYSHVFPAMQEDAAELVAAMLM